MRRNAAVVAARVTGEISRRLRIGGGTALPGLIAERVDPSLVGAVASQLGAGCVLVTGTNGKTTTARILRRIFRAAGLKIVANREGSNMMRGIAAALAEATSWQGSLEDPVRSVGVFEVDEAAMPGIAEVLAPRVVLFTNLFRDQLDRYGEVETVASLWQEAVAKWDPTVTLVLNADDPSVASLADHAQGRVLTYGCDDLSRSRASGEHAADARWCRRCGTELAYSALFYGHVGHWSCPGCGNARPTPDISCTSIADTGGGARIAISTPSGPLDADMPVSGTYNAYNTIAAVAAAVASGVQLDAISRGLQGITAAFGRQERITVGERAVEVILAKNPAGLNQVIDTIIRREEPVDAVFVLNDRIADGRDISWIWDADFELLRGRMNSLTVSGDRAWDMALRLKYAGLSNAPRVELRVSDALRAGLSASGSNGPLYVIPTYTAMLDVRNILGRWSGKGAFWEGGE